MSLGGPGKKPWERSKKPNYFGYYNDSNEHNPSHRTDQYTNFIPKTITLENIDQAVYMEFNNRFRVMERDLPLFTGDAEVASLPMMYFEQLDQDKGFLRWPFFVFTRTETKKMFRTNPAYKRVCYAVPKKKAQGIVIEEYITEMPVNWELGYEFTFVTYYREAVNQMEEQINFYFRNKRNIINYQGELFSIGTTGDPLCEVEMINRDSADQTTMYVLKLKCRLWCWTRNMETAQKRERPNSFTLDFQIKDENGRIENSRKDVVQIEKFIIDNKTKPDEHIDPT